ncbi:MAG: hypothetical protein DLM52_10495 [Chthoniobacterales bacterium]|nr:MAG: hypothetical protein DLM52_10495 [Chthoniobacterales bacterium]
MRRVLFATVMLALTSHISAQQPKTYSAMEAAEHIGEHITVVGKVAGVHKSEDGHILINLGAPYPNESLTVFVPKESADHWGTRRSSRATTS